MANEQTESRSLREIHDRIGSMIDQVGQPDYSLREMAEGLRRVRDDLLAVSEKEKNKALVRDAARYRFLRECRFLEIVTAGDQMFRVAGGDNLDKTVDAAATP